MNTDFSLKKRFSEGLSYKTKNRISAFLVGLFKYAFLITVGYIVIYPLLQAISMSFKSAVDYLDFGVTWIPNHGTLDNYKRAISNINLGESFFNTLWLEVVSAIIEVASCAIAAYGFSRFKFRGRNLLMFGLMLTMFIPPQMTIVPMMANFSHLDFFGVLNLLGKLFGTDIRPNILDTPLAFYLPSLFANGLRSGMLIYIYIQFFKGLPKELEEAAWIDGANPFRTFLSIVLPSSGVAILTVSIFSLVWHWNDYYLAVMYTTEDFPLAVALSQLPSVLKGDYNVIYSVEMAACIIFIIPLLLVYMVLQKRFIQSIDRIGITG